MAGRIRCRSVSLALAWMIAAAVVPSGASAGQATVVRHPVYGGMEASFGTCPDVPELPPPGTVCVDHYVLVWRGVTVVGGGSVAPPGAPWNVYAETVRLEFTGADEPVVTVLRSGSVEGPAGAFAVERVHLTTGSATVAVPMSDGSTFDFSGTWRAVGRRQVFGNDGPATGAPRHLVDRCRTFNALGHQKFRPAAMTGTLDGLPVHSYTSFDLAATIFNNAFRYIDVVHGSCR